MRLSNQFFFETPLTKSLRSLAISFLLQRPIFRGIHNNNSAIYAQRKTALGEGMVVSVESRSRKSERTHFQLWWWSMGAALTPLLSALRGPVHICQHGINGRVWTVHLFGGPHKGCLLRTRPCSSFPWLWLAAMCSLAKSHVNKTLFSLFIWPAITCCLLMGMFFFNVLFSLILIHINTCHFIKFSVFLHL